MAARLPRGSGLGGRGARRARAGAGAALAGALARGRARGAQVVLAAPGALEGERREVGLDRAPVGGLEVEHVLGALARGLGALESDADGGLAHEAAAPSDLDEVEVLFRNLAQRPSPVPSTGEV